MQCQRCGRRPATVHITKVLNGNKTELHLCQECAQETGELGPGMGPGFGSPFGFQELLSSFLEQMEPSLPGVTAPPGRVVRCERCGLTWSDFKRLGQLGCSHCYEQFRQQLGPVLHKLHGSTQHSGKAPKKVGGSQVRIRQEKERLRKQLEEAVAKEEYERAAQIRDRIRELEKQAGGR